MSYNSNKEEYTNLLYASLAHHSPATLASRWDCWGEEYGVRLGQGHTLSEKTEQICPQEIRGLTKILCKKIKNERAFRGRQKKRPLEK